MVRAAIDPVEHVMDMPATLFRDFLVAYGTSPFLLVPESDELFSLEPALEPASVPFVRRSTLHRLGRTGSLPPGSGGVVGCVSVLR
jgi:hypothetical protein